MSMTDQFERAIRTWLNAENDGYSEIHYSNKLVVQVWSPYPDETGVVEVYIHIPHKYLDDAKLDTIALFDTGVSGVEELCDEIDEAMSSVLDRDIRLDYHLMDVVRENVSNIPHNVYSSQVVRR